MQHTVSSRTFADKPPVLLLGGAENAVSCARRFTRAGIVTVVVNKDSAAALRSRGVVRCPIGPEFDSEVLARWLQTNASEWAGSVLIPLSDPSLITMIAQYDELVDSFRPALLSPPVVAAMLDKQATLQLASAAGVGVPRQWTVPDETVLRALLHELEYPIIMKPRRNFELTSTTGKKYLRADNERELQDQLPTMWSLEHGFVLNEFIPGGDDLLSSYYAVRSEGGDTLLEFTKRVDRRFPPNEGGATFHELVHLPATAEAGRRFFDAARVVGMANVEFKSDPRSGALKLIECNHRLTAANALMQDNGVDVAGAVYQQALGRLTRQPAVESARGTMWYPIRDFRSFRRSGDTLRTWFGRPKRSSFPYFDVADPGPSLAVWRHTAAAYLSAARRGRE